MLVLILPSQNPLEVEWLFNRVLCKEGICHLLCLGQSYANFYHINIS